MAYKENVKKYHIPSCANYMHRKENVVYYGYETTLHELWKCVGGFMINNYGDVFVTDEIKAAMKLLAEAVENKAGKKRLKKKEQHVFITETVPNEQADRRVDLVNLETDSRIEFETKKSINKGDDVVTIYIL